MKGKFKTVCSGSYQRVWLQSFLCMVVCPNCQRLLKARNVRSGKVVEESSLCDGMVPRHAPLKRP